MRDQSAHAVRDNVVFELGLFIGRLGKERTFFFIPRDQELHIPSDLIGITPGIYEPNRKDGNIVAALGPATNRVRKALLRFRPLQTFYSSSSSSSSSEEEEEEFDDNDIISILESWMGSRPSRHQNTSVIRYTDVDRELGLPRGSAKKHLKIVAERWDYVPSREGKATILFENKHDVVF